MFNIKFTPEAFFMLPIAIMLDFVGIILFCFLVDDFGITDMIGIAFIGGWLLLRGQKPLHEQGRKGYIQNIKNLFTDKKYKFIIPIFGELIPYLGVLPFWTISVLLNLSED
jgi:hypothetical protein